ncbi:hypothetical protein DFH28DRAFT_538316 [Melampsora americana]|nr:hypothetical protein DFH28DRAFT_538316 [Melampsora americana]
MIHFFWVILLQSCIIALCVDPTLGGDVLSAKVTTELGDHTLNYDFSAPNHLDMFPEIKTSRDELKAESPGDSKSGTDSGQPSSSTSNEIRDAETSASVLRGSHRGMPGKEFKRKVSKPYERYGMHEASPFKKYPQAHASRGQNGLRRSHRRPPQYLYTQLGNGHILDSSTAPLPQPEGWVPFFSNYDDAAEWLKFGSHYGNFHTLPLQPLWEPSRLLPGRPFGAHETYPPIYPHTTNPQRYNVHGRAVHGRVTSNWAQRSLRTPPLMTAKPDIASAPKVQRTKTEPPKEVENIGTQGKPPPTDVSSSSRDKKTLSAKSDDTAETSQPIQELLPPQDDEHQTKIARSDVADPGKSAVETPTDTDRSYYSVDNMNPSAKPISKDRELEKHAAKTATLPTQQSLDSVFSKPSYKSIALAGLKPTSDSKSKLRTSVADTPRIKSQSLKIPDPTAGTNKATFGANPVHQLLKGAQPSEKRVQTEVRSDQKEISDQTEYTRTNILKSEKKQPVLQSNHFFLDEGSESAPREGLDSLIQNSISSDWIRVKKKNRGAQKSSVKYKLGDAPSSQDQDTSEKLTTHRKQLAMDTKEFDASKASVFDPKDGVSLEVHETVVPESNTIDMQGSDSSKIISENSTPLESPNVFSGESAAAKDGNELLATFQKSERSKRKKKRTKKTKAMASVSTAEAEKEIEVSALHHDLPKSTDAMSGESSKTSLKSMILKVLQHENTKDGVQIHMTKEDFRRILLAQDDLVSLDSVPEVFGDKWRKAISDITRDSEDSFELFRRMDSLASQYTQMAIMRGWGLYKSKLSPQTQEACQLLKVDQEWPTFYNVDFDYLETTKTRLESLDINEALNIRRLFFDRNLDSRILNLYLMAQMKPHEKVFTESELVSLSKSGGSIPVLLQIWNLLELSIPEVNWKTFTKEQILEKLKGLKNIMQGKFHMDNGLEFDVDDLVWVASNTRAFILNSRLSNTFERRLKDFAKSADKLFPRKPAKQWMTEPTSFNWEDLLIGEGDALVAAHFSLDMKTLAVLKNLMTHQKKPTPPGMGHVIFWPGKAKDRMKQQMKYFAEFYKFHGFTLLSN